MFKLKSFDILCVYVFMCACKPRFYMYTFRRKNENTYMSEFVNLNFFVLTLHAHLHRRVQVEVLTSQRIILLCASLFFPPYRIFTQNNHVVVGTHYTGEWHKHIHSFGVYIIYTYEHIAGVGQRLLASFDHPRAHELYIVVYSRRTVHKAFFIRRKHICM